MPFADGDRKIEFLRGDSGALLAEPRDTLAFLYGAFPRMYVPEWRDPAATYPMPGVLVRPQPPSLELLGITAEVEDFAARGAQFDGATRFENGSTRASPRADQGPPLHVVPLRRDDLDELSAS